ncbi:MAG: protein kinase [Sandaracinaceae bacterium]|nr:protein kinase [Sandaracinaceae bacterium]
MTAATSNLLVERFELGRELGQGSTGTVYEAFDRERHQRVALKQLNQLDAQSIYLLKHEFRSLADLTHPGLVRLGELFAADQSVFFSMELVDGADFLAYVRCDDPTARLDAPTLVRPTRGALAAGVGRVPARTLCFDEERLRDALRRLFAVLEHLHARGRVHRDVKPSNVLIEPSGRLVLLDFGLSADLLGVSDRDRGWMIGTPRYMAPEQVRDDRVGPAADLYAAGVMLHEALVGQPPLDGSAREILFRKQDLDVEPLGARHAGVPPDLDALCVRLLAREPSARPAAHEALAWLGAPHASVRSRSSSPFVGRDAELQSLSDAFAASSEHAVAVWVEGESGTGKSELVRQFVTALRARERRVRVLGSRCLERERIAFNAVDGLVDALSRLLMAEEDGRALELFPELRDTQSLLRTFPVLRRVRALQWLAEGEGLSVAPQELRRRAFCALRAALGALASRYRLVIVLDDLQWADNDSRALLDELMHPPAAPRVLWLGTVRPGGVLGPLAGTDAARDLRRIALGGLGPEPARELAAHALRDAGLPTDAAPELAREARGHPMYLLELVELARAGGGRLTLDEALRARAARLPEPDRRVLSTVCLAALPLRQALVARAAGIEAASCLNAIDRLRRDKLVRTEGIGEHDRVEPYHDRVREALAASLDPRDARELHASVAHVLEAHPGELREGAALVHHLLESEQRARAAEHAARAAHEASRTLAFDQAARLYAIALEHGNAPASEHVRLRISLAEALRDAGRGREAGEAFVEAAAIADSQTSLQCEVAAAEQWVACGHLDQGLALLEQVLARLGVRWPRTQPEALVMLAVERAAVRMRGLDARPGEPLDPVERMRLSIFQSIGSGLGSVDPLRAWIFQSRALRHVLDTGDPELLVVGLALEVLLLGLDGARNEGLVRRHVTRLRELASRSRDPRVHAWAELADGGGAYCVGRLDAAPAPLAEAEQRFRDEVRVDGAGLNITRILKVWSAVFRGDVRQLAEWIPEYERDSARRDDRYAQVSLNLAGHVGWLVDGDLERAQSRIKDRAWTPPGGAYHLQSWYRLFARCEQALYRVGDERPFEAREREEIDRELGRFLRSLVYWRAEAARVVGTWTAARYRLALAVRGHDPERNRARARRAEWLLRIERVGYARIYAALLRATLAHQSGDAGLARDELRSAIDLAESQSFLGIAATARQRLASLGAARAGGEGWAHAQGVADLARMTAMYLPGFAV